MTLALKSPSMVTSPPPRFNKQLSPSVRIDTRSEAKSPTAAPVTTHDSMFIRKSFGRMALSVRRMRTG